MGRTSFVGDWHRLVLLPLKGEQSWNRLMLASLGVFRGIREN
jgi:hypothetical protein